MFSFRKNIQGAPFWHDKLFTVEWELLRCKWVLVYHKNSQRKSWYKRTERPYRFKRWFFKKGKDHFSNLANIDSPRLVFYIFSWYIAWPKKVVLPMDVRRLSAPSPGVNVLRPKLKYHLKVQPARLNAPVKVISTFHSIVRSPDILPLTPTVLKSPVFNFPALDWPISDWINKGLVKDGDISYSQLEKINNSK